MSERIKRLHKYTIRFSDEEAEVVKKAAAALGMSIGHLIRLSTLRYAREILREFGGERGSEG
ncbi:MAG: hypothetical protein QN229_07325, partial [Desulfurococcaceae archaeon TW002]